ncbi:MAG TPA: glucosamine-6-phosphate deaminase [Clostridia bacterium]|nr:glucosamine-6-phosphate deaminase [Clostridia bacterium]
MTRFIIARDYEDMSEKAAMLFLKQINKKDNSLLGLATGSSPVGIYRNLIKWHSEGLLDFSAVKTVSLDEYVGLGASDPQSYRHFMNENLFNHINIKMENTHVPNGLAEDLWMEVLEYEKRIEMLGGIDMQLLGIGRNAHIGFNEPSDNFATNTHVVNLTKDTREANARFFSSIDEVPTKALTMGTGTIMRAKKIVLVSYGENKADALYKSFFENTNPRVPGSILQYHADVTVVADKAAMGRILSEGKDINCGF